MSTVAAETMPEKPAAPRGRMAKILGGRFLLLSVVVHLLFAGVAAYVVVARYQANRKLTFKGGPPSPNPSTRALEHKVQMARKQSTMSAPAVTKKITTTGLAKVTLPEMPAMPKLAAPPVKMAGAGGADVGFNPGGAATSSGSGAGGAAVPFFGFREAKGGGSLVGTLFDLKQLKNRTPSKLDENQGFSDELYKFVTGGMQDAYFDKYFHSPNPLYTTQIFIPKIKSEEGPRAFGLGGQVEPKMWVVHYKGNVIPGESGTFRFVGVGDDILVVRFNGRVVLDCGSNNPSGHGADKFYAGDGIKLQSDMSWYKGSGRGEPVQVNSGESYPIDILIGEWPGGDFKAWLQIEKDGVQYEKDSKGVPILPIFKLAGSDVARPAGEAPMFAKQSVVWKAEKTKQVASASPTPH